MPLQRELTSGTYELVCGYREKVCKSVGVVFLATTATRLFLTRSWVTETIHAIVLASASIVLLSCGLLASGSKPMKAWYTTVSAFCV